MKLSSLASALFILSHAVSAVDVLSTSSSYLRRNDNAHIIEGVSSTSEGHHRMLPPKVRDHQWSNYQWSTTTLTVKDKLSVGYPKIGIDVWNNGEPAGQAQEAEKYCPEPTIGSPLLFDVTDESPDPGCSFETGEISVCNGNYGATGWLGIAEISIAAGGTITRGRAVNNDSYARMDDTRWKNLVLCQEVGHVLGLDHQDENFNNERLPTCMDYTSLTDVYNETPDKLDYDVLCRMYDGIDLFQCESGSDGGGGGGGGGPGGNGPPGRPAGVPQHVQEMQAEKFKHFGELSPMHPSSKTHAVLTKPDPEIAGNTLVTHLILAQDDDEVVFP